MERSVPLTDEELEDLRDWATETHPDAKDALVGGSTAQVLALRLLDEVEARRREAQGAETREEWRVIAWKTGGPERAVSLCAHSIQEEVFYHRARGNEVRIEVRTVTVGPWRRVEEE